MSFDGNPSDPSPQQPGRQPGYPPAPDAGPEYSTGQEYAVPGAEYPASTWEQPTSGAPGYVPMAAPPPSQSRMRNVWLNPAVIVGVLGTIVILMVAVTILALRSPAPPSDSAKEADGGDTQSQGADDSDEEGGTGTGSGNGSDQPSEEEESAPEGDEVFFSGQLEIYAGGEYSVDFDTGDSESTGYEDDPKVFDMTIDENGIGPLNKNTFGEWGDESAPTTAAECDGLADDLKSDSIHLSRLKQFATFCFTTAEDRAGYFTVDDVQLASNGSLDTLDFTFTVWKNEDDM